MFFLCRTRGEGEGRGNSPLARLPPWGRRLRWLRGERVPVQLLRTGLDCGPPFSWGRLSLRSASFTQTQGPPPGGENLLASGRDRRETGPTSMDSGSLTYKKSGAPHKRGVIPCLRCPRACGVSRVLWCPRACGVSRVSRSPRVCDLSLDLLLRFLVLLQLVF